MIPLCKPYVLSIGLSLALLLANFAQADSYPEKLNALANGAPHHLGVRLPPESYVEFKAYRLPSSKVLWINFDELEKMGIPRPRNETEREQLKKALLENFGYSSKAPSSSDFKTFYADRYGGDGLGEHAGSARAGTSGRFNTKGIGATPLRTDVKSKDHYNGVASLDEGIRESIKASVTQDLAIGSNPVLALIDSGTIETFKDGSKQPAVLIVRNDPIRSAHFMFNAHQDAKWKKTEFKRLNAAKKYLTSNLNTDLESGLKQYAENLGREYGSAFARKYYVVGISASNSDIQGKLLDFGPHTTLPGYGPYRFRRGLDKFGSLKEAKESQLKWFWEDIEALLPKQKLPSYRTLSKTLKDAYQRQIEEELIDMVGTPHVFSKALKKDPATQALAKQLVELISREKNDVTVEMMLAREARGDSLAEVMKTLSSNAGKSAEEIAVQLIPSLPEAEFGPLRESLAKNFSTHYRNTLNLAKSQAITDSSLREFFRLSGQLKNKPIRDLYSSEMLTTNQKLTTSYLNHPDPETIAQHIQDTIDRNRNFAQISENSLLLEIKTDHRGIAPTRYRVYDLKSGQTRWIDSAFPSTGCLSGFTSLLKSMVRQP